MQYYKIIALHFCMLSWMASSYSNDFLPENLQDEMILFIVDHAITSQNPNAGEIYLVNYSNNTFHSHLMNSNVTFPGSYTYSHIKNAEQTEIGILNSTHESGLSYEIVFYPENNMTGYYLYKAIPDSETTPFLRLNTGRYTRISPIVNGIHTEE